MLWPERHSLPVILATLTLLVVVLPPARARLKAVPTLAEAVGADIPRPLAPSIEVRRDQLGRADGLRYDPGVPAPAVVLVPGATPAGLQDARVDRVARALARARRQVFVPELALYDWRLDRADIDVVHDAVRALARRTRRPVTVLAFSYGGAPALLAAAELPERSIELMATFGAYFDLVGVLEAAATGRTIVDGRVLTWDPDPQVERLLPRMLARLAPAGERDRVEDALAGRGDPRALSGAARILYEMGTADDPARVRALVDQLPPTTRRRIDQFSPSAHAERISSVPVLALHDVADPAVPYAEALRLQAALPRARLVSVDLFSHVDLRAGGLLERLRAAPDLWHTWRYVGDLLGGQEPLVPAFHGPRTHGGRADAGASRKLREPLAPLGGWNACGTPLRSRCRHH